MAESVDISEDAVVVEVEEGAIEGNVHYCLFAERVTANRLLSSADVGSSEEVHDVTQLAVPHGSV